MRIKVQRDLCCGAQLCILAAPDVYRLDDVGYNDSDGDAVPPGMEDDAKRGALSCPEDAIRLESNTI
jgi:ferredoxin